MAPPIGTKQTGSSFRFNQHGQAMVQIRHRGAGAYIFVTNGVPMSPSNSTVTGKTGNGAVGWSSNLSTTGRPFTNYMVWHSHIMATDPGAHYDLTFKGRPGMTVEWSLYTAPPGTVRPNGPGWQPEDRGTHRHGR